MKKYSIKILPKGTLVEASEFSTILQTVLNQGLDYPFGCQSGNCGACKTKLISGKVNMISFQESLKKSNLFPLKPINVDVFQIN